MTMIIAHRQYWWQSTWASFMDHAMSSTNRTYSL